MAIASQTKNVLLERTKSLIPYGVKLLVAVSGGIDSRILFDVCLKLRSELGLTLHIAHVNHGLRDSSINDERFVEQLANQAGATLHRHHAKPPDSGINVESWGRSIRYSFFSEVLKKEGLDWIVTAHNSNDIVETFLMRLISNKQPRSIIVVDDQRRIIRPFLNTKRSEIIAYSKENQIEYVDDETNNDLSFLRNRVRHRLLPYLSEQFEGDLLRILHNRAQEMSQDIEVLDSMATETLGELLFIQEWGREWLIKLRSCICDAPEGFRWRIIECLLKPKLRFNLGRVHSQRVIKFLETNSAQIELPSGWILRRKGGGLLLLQGI